MYYNFLALDTDREKLLKLSKQLQTKIKDEKEKDRLELLCSCLDDLENFPEESITEIKTNLSSNSEIRHLTIKVIDLVEAIQHQRKIVDELSKSHTEDFESLYTDHVLGVDWKKVGKKER